MPHYNLNNTIYWFDTDAEAQEYQPTAILITDEEADTTRQSLIVPPTPNELILSQIAQLESTVTPRRYRESLLGIDNGWLADLNTWIDALRATLVKEQA